MRVAAKFGSVVTVVTGGWSRETLGNRANSLDVTKEKKTGRKAPFL
jgi:hypothetical protein